MITEYHDAWLLHKKPIGDTSLHLTFFTQEAGLLHCRYRGGRTLKKQSVLHVFMPTWLAMDSRHDWHYLQRVETLKLPLRLQGLSLFSGLYLNELLYYVLQPQDRTPVLFEAYQQTLKGMAEVNNRVAIEALLRRFEITLLSSCGYQLLWHEEVHLGKPIEASLSYRFIPGQGFESCEKGIPGHVLLALGENQFHDLQVLKAAKWIMRQAIDHLLDGRKLKSRSLFLSS